MAEDSPVQLVKLFPWMVFEELPASVFTRPLSTVATFTVIFEDYYC